MQEYESALISRLLRSVVAASPSTHGAPSDAPLWLPPEVIETPRMRLRKPLLEDAAAIFENYGQDLEVTRFLCWRPQECMDDALAAMHNRLYWWDRGTDFSWLLTPNGEPGTVMGMISATPERHSWRCVIGYVLAKEYWNKGFMTEAVKAIVAAMFKDPGIYRMWAVVDIENSASARVLEKAGMRCEGILRRWSLHPNLSDIPRDCWSYSVVK
ncbi:MAG: N-acetyltransferase [Verrucomicrobiaceae bacterium]|nr:MAG: N-acetyltransferase [Verrucomicrobiaceae bacterium]